MGIFDRLLSKNKSEDVSFPDEPKVLFGRYTDRNKTKEQYDSWDKSVNLFKEKKYLEAYTEFFIYLKDKEVENVTYTIENNRIDFSLIQGSKIVSGSLNDKEIHAEAEVARFGQINIPVMRKLLQENYYLYFSKFAIKNDLYTLKYFSPIKDAHPSSLYYALKEIATESDMYDDVLVEEFESTEAVNIEHIEEIPESEKQIKLKYFRKWTEEAIERVEALDSDKYTGAISYNLLNLAFKLYYMLAPEGTLLDDIRFVQSVFYTEDDRTIIEKNHHMLDEYRNLMEKTDDEIIKSFYKVKATFAVARPTVHERIAKFMKDELEKTKWYVDNNYSEIVQQICEYIVSYSCFTYGIPAVANDILMVFWRVFNSEIYNELGFKQAFYNVETKKFNGDLIKKRIQLIVANAKKRHSHVEFDPNKLNYNSLNEFAVSFIEEFQNLNYD